MSSRPTNQPPPSRAARTHAERASERMKVSAIDVVFQMNGQAPRFGALKEISTAGASLETARPHAVGDVVVLYLPWPSRDEPTGLTTVVRWAARDRMGVQFSMVGAEQLEAIKHIGRGAAPDTRKRAKDASPTDPFSRDQLLEVPKALFTHERRVRFQEVDAAGTIFFSRVFEYFGDVYHERFERAGVSIPKAMSQRDWLAPLVHAEADYLAPMHFGDVVRVCVVRVRCGSSAVTVGYRIEAPDGRVLTVGHTVHVFVDSKTFRPCPVPADIRRALVGES